MVPWATSGLCRNSLAVVLHVGVLAALMVEWPTEKPQVQVPRVMHTQLVMLPPAPAPAPEPVAPRPAPAAAAPAFDSRQYQPLSKQAPDYPERALDKNIEGDCSVEYTVNTQGRVENPKVLEGCHPLFMRPSLAAANTFRYQPRMVDGKPVPVPAVRNTFHYRIK